MQIRIGGAALCLDKKAKLRDILLREQSSIWPANLEPQSLMRITSQGKLEDPLGYEDLSNESEASSLYRLQFPSALTVDFSVEEKDSYTVFEILAASEGIDHLLIGPLFSSLHETIGEIVGIVQGDGQAFGIQALNPKTLAGFPAAYREQIHPLVNLDEAPTTSVATIEFTECAAYPARIADQRASLLQLFVEARDRPRQKDFLNFTDIHIPPLTDEEDKTIAGARFALFVCEQASILDTIEAIELAEGLPHPLIQGEWNKRTRQATRSYLIADFLPEEFEDLLNCSEQAGMSHLYHGEPFTNWGHFELDSTRFPDGMASLKAYASAAAKRNMGIGLHSLSTFTTTNDPYVSPRPEARLMSLAETVLSEAITAEDTVVRVEDSQGFEEVTMLQTLQIGDELIQFGTIENGTLSDLKRAAFGTVASAHPAGSPVRLLTDHPYRVFFPNYELQKSYAARLAELCREDAASMISFDGLEGCMATGEDLMAMNRFVYDFWTGSGRSNLITDASRLTHFLWHLHSRMNWGEPWGAKMREGMIEYRILNQEFFNRNLLPRMLGWFLLRQANRKFEATPPEDMEWALSMAAGFDAGFALSTTHKALRTNHCSSEMLDLIKQWESLRLAQAFDDDLRAKLRDKETEWQLVKTNDRYLLYPLAIIGPLISDLLEQQPGQAGGSDWMLNNPFPENHYDFRLRVNGYGNVHNPSFSNRKGTLKFNCILKPMQYLWFKDNRAYITDKNYQFIEEVSYQGQAILFEGKQNMSFACDWSGEEGPEVIVKFFVRNKPYELELV